MTPRGVAILGSTGSVGTAALRVLMRHSDAFRVVALTAYGNEALLAEQVAETSPEYAGLVEKNGAAYHHTNADTTNGTAGRRDRTTSAEKLPQIAIGPACLIEAATHPQADIVVNAVVGAAGLQATLAALNAGKRVALANKESLVIGGHLVLQACADGGGEIIPVDSEHSAILQCIQGYSASSVRRAILTASGGPFRGWSGESLETVTIADALRHPTWRMGRKITIDSATLANKALEVIEAHYLFGLPYDRVDVVVHPQSLVHSFVEFVDRSVIAQIGVPSMELPILYALTHPERVADIGVPQFDPIVSAQMTFEPIDHATFPTFRLGVEAGRRGGASPAIFNAANEQAVARFLEGNLQFTDIPRAIESALGALDHVPGTTLQHLLEADALAREHVSAHHTC